MSAPEYKTELPTQATREEIIKLLQLLRDKEAWETMKLTLPTLVTQLVKLDAIDLEYTRLEFQQKRHEADTNLACIRLDLQREELEALKAQTFPATSETVSTPDSSTDCG